MPGSRAEIDKDDLVAEAIEHCVFPLAPVEDVQRDGPRVYVRGDGVRTHGHQRPGISRHDELAYPGELTRVWQRRDRGRGRKAARAAPLRGNGHQSGAADDRACQQDSGSGPGWPVKGPLRQWWLRGGGSRHQDRQAIPRAYGEAARQQDHLALECLSRSDHGRARRHGLARYATHLRARRSRLLPDPRTESLPQPVRHGRRGVLRVLRRLSGAADRA